MRRSAPDCQVFRFVFNGNSVDVLALRLPRLSRRQLRGFRKQLVNQILSALNTFFTDDRFDRL